MKRYSDLEYLRLSKWEKFVYRLASFFGSIPQALVNLLKRIGAFFAGIFTGIAAECSDLVLTFKNGDWKTRTSYLVMGFGSIARGQVLRGVLFLLFEAVFIFYMIFCPPWAIRARPRSMIRSTTPTSPITTTTPSRSCSTAC